MMGIKVNKSCFEREFSISNIDTPLDERGVEDISSVFLLREMLRKLYMVNDTLNRKRNETIFEVFISRRYQEFIDMDYVNHCRSEFGVTGAKRHWGSYGLSFLSSYTLIEILIFNKIFPFDENPYELGMRIMERGNSIDRETYPKRFSLCGIWRFPIDLNYYRQTTPFIINHDDNYLNAINNYYKRENIEFTLLGDCPLPKWLKDDNERGHISEEYKNWL